MRMDKKLEQCGPKKIPRHDYARGLLRMHNIRSREIAKDLGVHESGISHVLSGKGKSRKIQSGIANALGMSFEELWS